MAPKMTVNKAEVSGLSRRGTKKYKSNPFLESTERNTKTGAKRITNKTGDKLMVVSESTGEIVAPAGFWHTQEVDRTQFVKLYINGVKAFKELTGAGTKVFEVLYTKVQKEFGRDIFYLSFHDINQDDNPMSESTFMRGIKELLHKDFIAESMVSGRYYLNPDYMWNGDRLAFVKEYKLNTPKKASNENQIDLFGQQKIN
jgi:hypothetical protein